MNVGSVIFVTQNICSFLPELDKLFQDFRILNNAPRLVGLLHFPPGLRIPTLSCHWEEVWIFHCDFELVPSGLEEIGYVT